MNNEAMMTRAKQLVVDYFNAHVDVTDGKKLTMEDVFVYRVTEIEAREARARQSAASAEAAA